MRDAASSAEPSADGRREIVGVVEDFPAPLDQESLLPMIYLPLRLEGIYPMTLAVRSRALTTAAVSERVREVAMTVDPGLRWCSSASSRR